MITPFLTSLYFTPSSPDAAMQLGADAANASSQFLAEFQKALVPSCETATFLKEEISTETSEISQDEITFPESAGGLLKSISLEKPVSFKNIRTDSPDDIGIATVNIPAPGFEEFSAVMPKNTFFPAQKNAFIDVPNETKTALKPAFFNGENAEITPTLNNGILVLKTAEVAQLIARNVELPRINSENTIDLKSDKIVETNKILKSGEFVKAGNSLKTDLREDVALKSESSLKAGDFLQSEKYDEGLKNHENIEAENFLKTDLQADTVLKSEKTVKTGESLETEKSLKAEKPLKTDKSLKAEDSLQSDEISVFHFASLPEIPVKILSDGRSLQAEIPPMPERETARVMQKLEREIRQLNENFFKSENPVKAGSDKAIADEKNIAESTFKNQTPPEIGRNDLAFKNEKVLENLVEKPQLQNQQKQILHGEIISLEVIVAQKSETAKLIENFSRKADFPQRDANSAQPEIKSEVYQKSEISFYKNPEIAEKSELVKDFEFFKRTEIPTKPEFLANPNIEVKPAFVKDSRIEARSELIQSPEFFKNTEITEKPAFVKDSTTEGKPEVFKNSEILKVSEITSKPGDVKNSETAHPQEISFKNEAAAKEHSQSEFTGENSFKNEAQKHAPAQENVSTEILQTKPENHVQFAPQILKTQMVEHHQVEREFQRVSVQQFAPVVAPQVQQLAQADGGTVRLVLMPEALGQVNMEVRVENGVHTTVMMQVETHEAKQQLEAQMPVLKEQLAQSGVVLEKINVEIKQDFKNQPQFGGFQQQQNQQARQEERESRQKFVNSFRFLKESDESKGDARTFIEQYI